MKKFLASFSVARRLTGLAAIGIITIVAISGFITVNMRQLDHDASELVQYQDLRANMHRLDTQAGHLKATAYRALSDAEPASLLPRVEEEVAALLAILDENDAFDLGFTKEQNEGFRAVFVQYGDGIAQIIGDAAEDPAAGPRHAKEIDAANEQVGAVLTPAVDGIGAKVVALAEAQDEVRADAMMRSILLGLLGLLLLSGAAVLITRSITRPLRSVVDVLKAFAAGDLTRRVPEVSHAELGELEHHLNLAVASTDRIVGNVAESAITLTDAAQGLSTSALQISAGAEETASQATVVSGAAEEVSRNVQTVAAGSEQMTASIREIAHSANEAARVASDAVRTVESTNQTVSKLGESSQEIGNVVKVITSIAEQTNLLALNATIEAARAGEAGKGFAVVANEVKELAQETARATEDIARRVETIQGDTTGAVAAIGEIDSIIRSINDYQLTIASAVEEQTATTNEMGRNVAEAATGTDQITENIVGVARAAESTREGVVQTEAAAADLARMSAELQTQIGHFTRA